MNSHSKKSQKGGALLEEVLEDFDDEPDEMQSRTVFLVGDIEEVRIKKAVRRILSLAEQGVADDPIYLYLSTFGGCVDEAMALYDVMKYVPCPVHTLGFGKIMSAGCLLLAGGEAGERIISPNARMMYHAGWDEILGNIWEIDSFLAAFKKQERLYDELVAGECGRDVAEVEALYANKRVDHYMNAQEVVDFGFADRIASVTRPRSKKR